jgi:hypothetical protein
MIKENGDIYKVQLKSFKNVFQHLSLLHLQLLSFSPPFVESNSHPWFFFYGWLALLHQVNGFVYRQWGEINTPSFHIII